MRKIPILKNFGLNFGQIHTIGRSLFGWKKFDNGNQTGQSYDLFKYQIFRKWVVGPRDPSFKGSNRLGVHCRGTLSQLKSPLQGKACDNITYY